MSSATPFHVYRYRLRPMRPEQEALASQALGNNRGVLVKVNPAYTSQTCPVCQHIDESNRESQAVFRCKACGFQDHADRVGATNIRTRAMETLMTQGFPQPKTTRHRRPCNPKKRKVQTAQAA